MTRTRLGVLPRILITALVLALTSQASVADLPARSGFGTYTESASKPDYTERFRSSRYVAVRDGVRLAVDIYRPAVRGEPAAGRFPVVWTFTPYNRAVYAPDGSVSPSSPQIELVNHGYVVVVADVRGKGASFGVRKGPADQAERSDAYDLTEWLAAQPWSNGNVGMMGCSYMGTTALQAVGTGAPHLKAAFIGTTMFDMYEAFARGGITSSGLPDEYYDASKVVPVDEDKDRGLLARALKEHEGNTSTRQFFASTPFRDDINPVTGDDWWVSASFYPYLRNGAARAALYFYGGFFDSFSDAMTINFRNSRAPSKLTLGNWAHCETPGLRLDLERLRFFDYWLKGIRNGVMSEPPVHVYVEGAPDGTEWRALPNWPPQAARTKFFLSETTDQGKPKSRRDELRASFKDGSLLLSAPSETQPSDTVAPGMDVTPAIHYYVVRSGVDAYSLTYTLPPQPPGTTTEIVGHPTVSLWLSSTAPDADIYAYLEVIHNPESVADVIATGVLRASHRKLGTAPYQMMGLPWQSHARADVQPLEYNVPIELQFRLTPIARVLRPGERLRLAVTSRPPRALPDGAPPAPINLYHDPLHASYLEVPIVRTGTAREE